MIYTVECRYTDPASESEWNAFYSRDKLPALISVPGFLTSQRFKAFGSNCPAYLALHTVEGAEVLDSAAYFGQGGGNFAAWQPHIADWYRNLYSGLAKAPAVGGDALLALSANSPDPLLARGFAVEALQAAGLACRPARRWLAVVDLAAVDADSDGLRRDGIELYQPITAQLLGAGVVPACG